MLTTALTITCGIATAVNAEGGTNDLAPVDVVEVNGLIDEIVVHDIEQAINRAEASSSQAVILQVNSLGSVVSSKRIEKISYKIAKNHDVRNVVYRIDNYLWHRNSCERRRWHKRSRPG